MSSYEDRVVKLLKESTEFGQFNLRREVHIKEISPFHSNSNYRYDIVLPELRLIIEVHGEQHINPTRFGGMSKEEARAQLSLQKTVDSIKTHAAIDSGWIIVVVYWYELDHITAGDIYKRFLKQSQESDIRKDIPATKIEKARQKSKYVRQQQYRRYKAFRKKRRKRPAD